MGQRSQIYIRYKGDLAVARYYQWNYGERMISSARYGIEWIKEYLNHKLIYQDEKQREQLVRILDTNFDFKDVVISSDIIDEFYKQTDDQSWLSTQTFDPNYIFLGQDNNDGKLLIDIMADDHIKYAFLTFEQDSPVMDADRYMCWDMDHSPWEDSPYSVEVDVCRKNIDKINEIASLMTKEEVNNFLKTRTLSYTYVDDRAWHALGCLWKECINLAETGDFALIQYQRDMVDFRRLRDLWVARTMIQLTMDNYPGYQTDLEYLHSAFIKNPSCPDEYKDFQLFALAIGRDVEGLI